MKESELPQVPQIKNKNELTIDNAFKIIPRKEGETEFRYKQRIFRMLDDAKKIVNRIKSPNTILKKINNR